QCRSARCLRHLQRGAPHGSPARILREWLRGAGLLQHLVQATAEGGAGRFLGAVDHFVSVAGVRTLRRLPWLATSMGMPLVRRSFTVDEYHRLAEAGILGEDDRVELIDGQVVAMTLIGPARGSCVNRLNMLFAPLAGRQATVSVQNPLVLGEHEEPQPDLTVLRYRADGYRERHPGASDVL